MTPTAVTTVAAATVPTTAPAAVLAILFGVWGLEMLTTYWSEST